MSSSRTILEIWKEIKTAMIVFSPLHNLRLFSVVVQEILMNTREKRRGKQIFDDSKRSLVAAAAVFAIIFVLGLFILHFFTFPVDAKILDTHVRILNLESTWAQSRFYLSLLGLFAAICAASLFWPSAKIIPVMGRADHILVLIVVIAAIFLGSGSNLFLLPGFLFVTILLVFSRTFWFDQIAHIWMRPRLTQKLPFPHFFSWLAIGIIFFYIVIFLIAPLSTPLLIRSDTMLLGVEGHYATTILSGFDLICCSEVGTIERANYGLGMPLLTALTLKLFPFFGLSDTALVQAVKMHQLIAVTMICFLCYLTNRKYSLYIIVLALGLTAFMLSNVGPAVNHPNQTGIRYIPILASLIVLVLEMRRTQFRIWLLASAAAVFVILSPETGLATTAGYIVAIVLKRYDPKLPIASIASTFMRFGMAFFVTGMAGSVLVIGPILKNSPGELFQFLSLFAIGGYGGLVEKPSMSATLLFFVATATILDSVWRARRGDIVMTDAYGAAVATIMLIWLMYYVNRMAESNLWFQWVLLVLLIAPHLTREVWQNLFRKPLKYGVPIGAIIACMMGGQIVSSSLQIGLVAGESFSWQFVRCDDNMTVDGKCLPWFPGSKFELQMNVLIENYSPDETLVLSGVPTYVRLRGFNDGVPLYSPMEARYEKDVDGIVNWIERHGPKYILADDPSFDIALAAPERSRQIQKYLSRLISYRELRREDGWVVLERI
ncbi:MAG: hypothetical protein AVO39_09265 [delta proteobacterium MLS_D]|nr:MAG: hypothetical protein AVO39_09265 [delta proteobacterium MLS_D]